MYRSLYLGAFVLILAGCQSPAERLPINRLPDDSPPLPYAELLTRARMQASAANEAFYVNRWSDLASHPTMSRHRWGCSPVGTSAAG